MRRSRPTALLTFAAFVQALTGCGDDAAGTGGGGGGTTAATTTSASSATGATTTSDSASTTSDDASASSASSGDGGGGAGGTGSQSSTGGAGGNGGEPGTGGAGGEGTGGSGGSGSGGSDIDPRFQPVIDAALADLDAFGAPGGAIAIIEDGEVTFARGVGVKTPGGDDPVDAGTLFRIGSVNKTLTAIAFLAEVERGTIDLDAPLSDVVPDFTLSDPPVAPAITPRQLLSHTAALSDYLVMAAPEEEQADAALHDYLTSQDFRDAVYLMAPAGAFWNYSNSNYYVAGLALETAAEMPYRDALSDHVFDPLGMQRTFFLAEDVLADGNYAVGLTAFPDVPNPVEPDSYDNAWGRPAGFATSNVLDLAEMVKFLMAGDEGVLSDALRGEMTSAQVDTRLIGGRLGYGFGLDVYDGYFLGADFHTQPLLHHGGDIAGFGADIYFLPEAGFGVVALASADGAHLDRAVHAALELAPDGATGEPPDVSITAAERASYTGTYLEDVVVGDIIVTTDHNQLRIEMPALDANDVPYDPVLVHYAKETFILTIQGIQTPISFVNDATYARTRFFVGTRDGDIGLAPAAPLPADARRERIERLVEAMAREPGVRRASW